MQLHLQMAFKNNPKEYMRLKEHSYLIKELNRGNIDYKVFTENMKKTYNERLSDKINNVVQYQEDSKTNITNENIKENKEESNISKKHSVEKSYFNDALFIGDSRTIGISEYGDLNNATFFAYTGMSVYNVFSKTVSVPKVGKLNLEQLLSSKKFGKIYIMLGINELGYNTNQTLENYKKLVDYIKDSQSSAIIYIQANLHVASKKSDKDSIVNNTNINKFNDQISKFADNKRIFYIDINEKFDDDNGNLNSNYTSDNVHIYAKYYKEWSNWLCQNAVD